jgi:hypothetical protein
MSQTTHPTADVPARSDGTAPGVGWEPQQIAAVAIVAVCGVLGSLTQSLLIPVLPELQAALGSGDPP